MKYPVIYCRWLDSVSRHGWHPLSDDADLNDCEHVSVGFLVRETDRVIVITNSHSDYRGDALEMLNDPMTIPKAAILERRIVVKADA